MREDLPERGGGGVQVGVGGVCVCERGRGRVCERANDDLLSNEN